VQAAQQAGDLAGLLFGLFGEREWSPSELRSEVAIVEAVQGVLTGDQDLEERAVFPGERIVSLSKLNAATSHSPLVAAEGPRWG
jgi:hypothetical protein